MDKMDPPVLDLPSIDRPGRKIDCAVSPGVSHCGNTTNSCPPHSLPGAMDSRPQQAKFTKQVSTKLSTTGTVGRRKDYQLFFHQEPSA